MTSRSRAIVDSEGHVFSEYDDHLRAYIRTTSLGHCYSMNMELVRAGHATPILEWADVDWDAPPKYAMAPEKMTAGSGCIWARNESGFAKSMLASIIEKARLNNALYGNTLYKRHDSHPEVLERVWEREKASEAGPVICPEIEWVHKIETIDWAAVHAVDAPPTRSASA